MWTSELHTEVLGEFIDAQTSMAERLRRNWWAAHSLFVLRHQQAKKRHSLRALRARLFGREAIECKNPKCRVRFVPYYASTTYCTAACRVRCLSLAYQRRKHPKAPVAPRACAQCGVMFSGRRVVAKYCSMRCNETAVRRRAVAKRAPVMRACAGCGVRFEQGRRDQAFCTRPCAQKTSCRRWYQRHHEELLGRKRAAYKRYYGARREVIRAKGRAAYARRKARRSAA